MNYNVLAQYIINSKDFLWLLENIAQANLMTEPHDILNAITTVIVNNAELRTHIRKVIKDTQDILNDDIKNGFVG